VTGNFGQERIMKKEYDRLATDPKVTIADLKALEGWRDVIPEICKGLLP